MNYRRRSIAMLMLCVVLVVLSACGATKDAAKETAGKNQGGTAEAQKPKEVKNITIAEPTRALAFAPVYAAISKGFFEKEGINVSLVSGGGGTQTLATLMSGNAQFTAATPITFFTLLESNQDMLAIASFNKGLPFQTVLSNQYIEKKGLNPGAPLKDKVAALKGAKIGVITLGSAQELYIREKLLLGGLNPDDVTVTAIGNPSAIMVALKEGIIDGTIFSPPTPQQIEAQNLGKIWLDGSDFKDFDGMDSQWLFGMRNWIESNPETTKAVVKGLSEGIAFVRDQPAEAAKAIQSFFEGVDVSILEKSLKDIKYAFEGDGTMTEDSWQKAIKPLRDITSVSKLSKTFDMKENGFWTNKYISK